MSRVIQPFPQFAHRCLILKNDFGDDFNISYHSLCNTFVGIHFINLGIFKD